MSQRQRKEKIASRLRKRMAAELTDKDLCPMCECEEYRNQTLNSVPVWALLKSSHPVDDIVKRFYGDLRFLTYEIYAINDCGIQEKTNIVAFVVLEKDVDLPERDIWKMLSGLLKSALPVDYTFLGRLFHVGTENGKYRMENEDIYVKIPYKALTYKVSKRN